MNIVREQSFEQLCELIGSVVEFRSDCEFFPNFNVVGRVVDVRMNTNNEITFTINTIPNNRRLDIGANMKNLRYEIKK